MASRITGYSVRRASGLWNHWQTTVSGHVITCKASHLHPADFRYAFALGLVRVPADDPLTLPTIAERLTSSMTLRTCGAY